MSMPFYVSPEQVIKDKADYARKGIARGRSVVVLQYAGGLLFVAENPSRALHKISEIYDRIAFAAVGKYNEFENLRVAGVRLADLRGYSYDRRDVTGRSLANAYAQTLGTIFTETPEAVRGRDRRRRGRRDRRTTTSSTGSPSTARSATSTASWRWAARPSRSPPRCSERWTEGLALEAALRLAVELLALGAGRDERHAGREPRTLTPAQLEVAVLDRARPRRKFRRITGPRLADAARRRRRLRRRRRRPGAALTPTPRPAA